MKKMLFAAAAALPLAAFALPAAGHAQAAPPASSERPVRRNRDRIEHEEVAASRAVNAYDLVQGSRSNWLSRHRLGFGSAAGSTSESLPSVDGANSGGDLIVLMDGALLGSIDALKQISLNQVWSVEFLSPSATRQRFDRATRDGAIVVYSSADTDTGARRGH